LVKREIIIYKYNDKLGKFVPGNHRGNPSDIAYSPDGKYLVVGTSTGIVFHDPKDFSIIHYIKI
jgi:hypothetical protein